MADASESSSILEALRVAKDELLFITVTVCDGVGVGFGDGGPVGDGVSYDDAILNVFPTTRNQDGIARRVPVAVPSSVTNWVTTVNFFVVSSVKLGPGPQKDR